MLSLCTKQDDKQGLSLDLHISQGLYARIGRSLPHSLLVTLEHSGNGLIWIPAALLVMLLPRVPWQLRLFAVNLQLGFLLDLLFVGLLKVLVRRPRPTYHCPGGEYNHIVEADKYSFPSGHASRCIFIALMLVVFRATTPLLAVVLACVWATCTAMSRVLLGRHYVSDVLAGALLGVAIAALVSQARVSLLVVLDTRLCVRAPPPPHSKHDMVARRALRATCVRQPADVCAAAGAL